jgi:hypothetical protein
MSEESRDTLWTALLALQGEALTIQKDTDGQIGSRTYKYAGLGGINEQLLPRLTHYGLLWLTEPAMIPERGYRPGLKYTLTHVKTGEALTGLVDLCVGDDPNPQEAGSGYSYMRRYTLMCLLNLVARDTDDDGAKASVRPGARRAPAIGRPLSEAERNKVMSAVLEAEPKDFELLLASVGVSSDPSRWTSTDALRIRHAIDERAQDLDEPSGGYEG